MKRGPGKSYGYHTPLPTLLIKEPPASLLALRTELALPANIDIYQASFKGASFEDCIGIIAAKLDIALDGDYEPDKLCEVLVEAMRARGRFASQPHLRAAGLVAVELEEKEGEVEIKEIKESDGTIIAGIVGDDDVSNNSVVPLQTEATNSEKDEDDVAIH